MNDISSKNNDSASAMEVFCSYAHEDEKWRELLEKWLVSLRRENFISIWHDREISAGKEWAREIDKHLGSAQIILLLISQDFINSDYCYLKEMQRALERHENGLARVVPIILSPVDLEHTPFNKLNALPKDAKPVTEWSNLDGNFSNAFLDISKGIRKAVDELRRSNIQRKISDKMTILEVLIKHSRGINVEKLKQETGLSDISFNEADTQLFNLDYMRRGPTTRVITEEGRKFWRAHLQGDIP